MRVLLISLGILSVLFAGCQCPRQCAETSQRQKWISLFDGKSLNGWKASENTKSFRVEDGKIVADGGRSHLFYTGHVNNAAFTNFEFKADVMTMPGANAGLYFHTAFQESGWPGRGLEVQVNNSYKSDPRKTGSLYGLQDVLVTPIEDNKWFTEHIIVEGKHVTVKVNGVTLVDYTEPDDAARKISGGTFALQCHDPKSKVYFKNIMVRPLN